AVYPPDASNVLILAPQRSAAGALDSAWRTVEEAEAAARALAAAGDSLARLQQAAAALRQRQLDSLKAVLGIARPDSLAVDSLGVRPDSAAVPDAAAPAAAGPLSAPAAPAGVRVPRRDSVGRRDSTRRPG
ncbi:MAG TPA: hypothetical protein VFV33_19775, partial [Gemmatimonadaceae bacterium]|nr:hypothetical protein [Gemmatimonadaceae bacterium]